MSNPLSNSVVRILGNEGAFSEDNTSYLIDNHILVDCSAHIFQKLKSKNLLDNIDTLIFTHAHNDHIGGLSDFVEYKRIVQQSSEYTIYAGDYFKKHYQNLGCCHIVDGYIMDFKLELIDYDKTYSSGNFSIEFFDVLHMNGKLQTSSVKIKNTDNKAILISADFDNDFIPQFFDYVADDCKYIFCDMGWTGYDRNHYMVHPDEDDIFEYTKDKFYFNNIIGIHCANPLKHFSKAECNAEYYF